VVGLILHFTALWMGFMRSDSRTCIPQQLIKFRNFEGKVVERVEFVVVLISWLLLEFCVTDCLSKDRPVYFQQWTRMMNLLIM
jgi:hypothetical protein